VTAQGFNLDGLGGFQQIGLYRSSVRIIYFTAGAAITLDIIEWGNGCKMKSRLFKGQPAFFVP
jgi:hypothetical protein